MENWWDTIANWADSYQDNLEGYWEESPESKNEAKTGELWSTSNMYGIGIQSGGVSQSDFTTYDADGEIKSDLSEFGLAEKMAGWSDDMLAFTDNIGEGIPGGGLVSWAGSEEQSQENLYLKELTETYRTMSADVMDTRAKTFNQKTKVESVAGKTNLVGSGSINRVNKSINASHEESIKDSYSDFLEDKSGIMSDIAGARQDWVDWNQNTVNTTTTQL